MGMLPFVLCHEERKIESCTLIEGKERSNDQESIVLVNPNFKEIKNIEMFNILGQSIFETDDVPSTDYVEYKVGNLSTGTYILKINTQNSTLSKKVLVE